MDCDSRGFFFTDLIGFNFFNARYKYKDRVYNLMKIEPCENVLTMESTNIVSPGRSFYGISFEQ